jgi:hypothetical protein
VGRSSRRRDAALVDAELDRRQLDPFGVPLGPGELADPPPLVGTASRLEYVLAHLPELGSICAAAPLLPER